MVHEGSLRATMNELDRYDYDLPRELIAQHPLPQRADSRLLVACRQNGSIEHRHVRDLAEYLEPGDSLVLNDTRVVPARLVGRRTTTGGRWTGLFLQADRQDNWRILSKTRGKLKPGETITLEDRQSNSRFRLMLLAKESGGVWLARPETDGRTTMELLEQVGRVPLPPYIRDGQMMESDRERYQTVYAEQPGAVAAPTAGLHFTQRLLDELEDRGVQLNRVTLHVGLGTFRPITVEHLDQHEMHSEWARIDAETVERLNRTRAEGGRIVAVGTTVVRTLERAAAGGKLAPFEGETNLFIRPPYRFRAVDAMLTNFHLPKSTLLVLIYTFGGDALMRRAYQEAIEESYRFYSYGDAMLIL